MAGKNIFSGVAPAEIKSAPKIWDEFFCVAAGSYFISVCSL
jgi:hypothetical protein